MAGNAPPFRLDEGTTVYNGTGSALGANLVLVPDSGSAYGAKIPGAASTATIFAIKGVSTSAIAAATYGTAHPEGLLPIKASGNIAKGDLVFVDGTAGKEGRVKKYTNFAGDGVVMIMGVAETAGADGEIVSVLVTSPYVKTA